MATAVLLACREDPYVAPAASDLAVQNAACEGCHIPEAVQWRQSLHRASFSNDAFARSFAREPEPFCQGCHAPHADPKRPPPAWAAENGVTCIACHGAEVVRAAATPRSRDPAPHALLRGGEFAVSGACASCHEFDFPVSRQHPPGRKMQRTASEHARSEFADVGCAACHMASTQGRRDHRFAASRDPELLRAAISVEARRAGADLVQLRLAPVGVGHAFPTGDLFRRIELRVEARDSHGELAGKAIRHLARHFPARVYTGPDAGRPDPLEPDDRLTGPTSVEITVPGATLEHFLKWRVTYQRVDRRDPIDPERSSLAGAVVLAEGTLAGP
ncbi:MAG TPA: multiheme c-type cytochrome [Nannocystis sp.]